MSKYRKKAKNATIHTRIFIFGRFWQVLAGFGIFL
jgi:hypothetical protein